MRLSDRSSPAKLGTARAIGGRIKSDLRFSNTFVYNSFPLPRLTSSQRSAIVSAAAGIVTARAAQNNQSLATLYEPDDMSAAIVSAHDRVDAVVDKLFGVPTGASSQERQRILFRRYADQAG